MRVFSEKTHNEMRGSELIGETMYSLVCLTNTTALVGAKNTGYGLKDL